MYFHKHKVIANVPTANDNCHNNSHISFALSNHSILPYSIIYHVDWNESYTIR